MKQETASTSISSLSPSSQLQSPNLATAPEPAASPANSTASSLSEQQPPPMPAVPQYQTFGADPSTFDDPTIYHIREIEAGLSEEEIKEIYAVAGYPHDDLHDLIPGTPPDSDFSNAKPTNQVAANTFATYIEPYFRPLNEEDLAFLRERVRPGHNLTKTSFVVLTSCRAIERDHSSSLVEASDTILKSGRRRMERS